MNVNDAGFKILKNLFLLMFFEEGDAFIIFVRVQEYTLDLTVNVNITSV